MLPGMGTASGLGDRIGIVPLMLIDAGFNILVALLTFALIRVALAPAPSPDRVDTAIGKPDGQEVAPQSLV